VMHYKGVASTIDPNTIKIEEPQIEMPPLDFGGPKQKRANSLPVMPREGGGWSQV